MKQNEEIKKERERKSAVQIQKIQRGIRNRSLYEKMKKNEEDRKEKEKQNAAKKIQDFYLQKKTKKIGKEKGEIFKNIHRNIRSKVEEKERLKQNLENKFLNEKQKRERIQKNSNYEMNNYNLNEYQVRHNSINLNEVTMNELNQQNLNIYRRSKELINRNYPNNGEVELNISNLNKNYTTILINKIEKDKFSEGAIKSSFLGLLSIRKPQIRSINLVINNRNIYNYELNIRNNHRNVRYEEKLSKINEYKLLHFLFNQKKILDYQSLIDVAGIILETPKSKIINMIFDIFEGKKKVLYMNEQNIKIVKISENLEVPYNNEIYKTDDLFIYYDQKNTVGVDFKQPIFMHGLVTLSLNDKITDVSQGIFRLRKMNITHSIDFYLNNNDLEKLKEGINNNELKDTKLLLKLYKILKKNGDNYIKDNLGLMQIQILKYLNRRANNNSLYFIEVIDYIIELIKDDKLYTERLIEEFKNDLNITQNIKIEYDEKTFLESITFDLEENREEESEKEKNKQKLKNITKNRVSKPSERYIKFKLMKKLLYTNFMNGNISLTQFIESGNMRSENMSQSNEVNILQFNILGRKIYLSNEIILNYNEQKLNPSKIYYLNYNNNEKHILIGSFELYNFRYRYLIFNNLYKKLKSTRRNGNNMRNLENSQKMLLSIFDNTSIEELEEKFSKFKIYDSVGDCVFTTNEEKRNLFNKNGNINNNITNQSQKLFIELLYLVIFYKKYTNLNKLYQLLMKIPIEEREKIRLLMLNLRQYYYLDNYNIDSSYPFNFEDDNNLLGIFKFEKYMNNSGSNLSSNMENKSILLQIIKTDNFNI